MKKIILFLTIIFNTILFPNFLSSHVNHYGNLKSLEYEIYLNNELIGTHVFNFKKEKDKLSVTSKGYFKVKKLGIDLMNYSTTTKEIYLNGQLNNFISETFQNDKRKYVNLKLNNNEKMFDIDGSSFKGQQIAIILLEAGGIMKLLIKMSKLVLFLEEYCLKKLNF